MKGYQVCTEVSNDPRTACAGSLAFSRLHPVGTASLLSFGQMLLVLRLSSGASLTANPHSELFTPKTNILTTEPHPNPILLPFYGFFFKTSLTGIYWLSSLPGKKGPEEAKKEERRQLPALLQQTTKPGSYLPYSKQQGAQEKEKAADATWCPGCVTLGRYSTSLSPHQWKGQWSLDRGER